MRGVETDGRGGFHQVVSMRENPVEAKRYIGFLPQKPPLYNDLTVEEFLAFTANIRRIPTGEVAEAIKVVMGRCGLSHFRKRLVRNLSGGYQQRLGIAQAIIHNPAFVVLDEPTNGLDPNQIVEIRHLIKEIAEERTVILSTHILSEVQATCDYIRMIEEGQVVFAGTVEEFDNYIVPNTIFVSFGIGPARGRVENALRSGGCGEYGRYGLPGKLFGFPGSDYPDCRGECDPELAIVGDTYGEEFHG